MKRARTRNVFFFFFFLLGHKVVIQQNSLLFQGTSCFSPPDVYVDLSMWADNAFVLLLGCVDVCLA